MSLRIYAGFALALLGVASVPCAAQQRTSVDVALTDVSINKVPFLIAADTGIYEKQGLDVHQFITPAAAKVAANSGVIVPPGYVNPNIDAAPIQIGGGSPMINAVIEGRAVARVIVSTTENIITDHVIAAATIASIGELKGKRLGYSYEGTVTHFGALSLARRMGWKPGTDITLVRGGSNMGALKAGTVDAFLGSAMLIALAPAAGFHDIGDLTKFGMPLAGSGIMAERTWLVDNRATMERFLKAAVEATALMKTDRKVFDAAIAKWFNIKDRKVQDGMFAAVEKFPGKPYPAADGIKAVFQMYDSPGMREHRPEEFYDSSLIADLDHSGFLDHPLQ